MQKLPRECTVTDAAGVLGCHVSTVYRLIEQGDLRYRDAGLGGRTVYRVRLDDVELIRTRYERKK